MKNDHAVDDLSEVERRIYGLALSLDSLVLNGIQFGVCRMAADGFLKKVGDYALQDLQVLEDYASVHATRSGQNEWAALKDVRAALIELINLLNRLRSFRSFSLQELHAEVCRVAASRKEIARLIGEIEESLPVAKQFYKTRPKASAEAMEAFVANLPQLFETEWQASRSGTKAATR